MTVVAAPVTFAAMRWWHIPAVMQLEVELFGDEAWTPEMFWSELANPDAWYRVAEDPGTGETLGYAGLAVVEPESYVQTIGVRTSAQRRGIGRRLMEALLAEAVVRGATNCWLEVRADNATAQRLYRSLGFADRGLRRGYYQPSGADALIMAVDLPAVTR